MTPGLPAARLAARRALGLEALEVVAERGVCHLSMDRLIGLPIPEPTFF